METWLKKFDYFLALTAICIILNEIWRLKQQQFVEEIEDVLNVLWILSLLFLASIMKDLILKLFRFFFYGFVDLFKEEERTIQIKDRFSYKYPYKMAVNTEDIYNYLE